MQMNKATEPSKISSENQVSTSLLLPYPTKAHVVQSQWLIHVTSFNHIAEGIKRRFLGLLRLFNRPLSHYGAEKSQKAEYRITILATVQSLETLLFLPKWAGHVMLTNFLHEPDNVKHPAASRALPVQKQGGHRAVRASTAQRNETLV